ncbi:hypothetical protein E4U21_001573 [Claviceps maximensis]|nr:hypothetical protein E4U21_001573 [Claviceps maximensis]
MAQRPSRRSHYDDLDEYYAPAPAPHDLYYGSPPPQRHKSERRSRRRSPDAAPQVDAYAPRRGHPRREPPESLIMGQPADGRRARSPPPYYTSEPLPRRSRRDEQREEYRRDPRRPQYAQDRHSRDYNDGGYQSLPKEKPRRSHRDDLDYRPRRDKAPSPVDYGRHRPRDRDDAGYRPRQPRPSSPESRPRARNYISSPFGSDDEMPRRRARSHDRNKTRDVFSPRDRDYHLAYPSPKPSHARRKSAPAPPSASAPPEAAKKQWWQNPYVQAGALTALSAGAQAVMQSRNDPSPWLGAKGAKVATAALGAALVDGLGGKKQQPRR